VSAATAAPYRVAGSYFEACNCEAICPCRRVGPRFGGRPTYGDCDFILSWWIAEGTADGLDLGGLRVVMAGSYSYDEPGRPWRVILYVDERASTEQQRALQAIYLGGAGGTPIDNYAAMIEEVIAVRPARIELSHDAGRRSIRVADIALVEGDRDAVASEPVSCGIPGHDRPGQEVVVDLQRIADGRLSWELEGRCGFASDFDYRSR
jgi:hypothetical protein